jgi:hypothetical protein
MKKRISAVLKTMTQAQLADALGYGQPRINEVAKKHPEARVHFDGDGKPESIQYEKTVIMNRKG